MKKLWTVVLLVALTCSLLVGCTKNDEEAIKQVITQFYQAGFNWDYQGMKDRVVPEFPIYDSYETTKNTYLDAVSHGFLVEADLDKFIEADREFERQRGESLAFSDWEIEVTGDVAVATVSTTGTNVDFAKLQDENGELAYRDELFLNICQMDELTAKELLSPEEFSDVHLQVLIQEYQLWLDNLSTEKQRIEIQLRKDNGQWRIVGILPAE